MATQHILMPLVMLIASASTAQSQSTSAPPSPNFILPLACEIGRTCEVQNLVDRDPTAATTDYLCGSVSYNDHSGVDFRLLNLVAMRAGVAVVAAAPGRVSRVRDGVADVSVRSIDRQSVDGRECGNGVVIDHGAGLSTQYCHLRNGSVVARAGTQVRAGETIAQVGLSGNTEYPHLHFTVRRGETVIDPFAPLAGNARNRCGSGQSMWQPGVARSLNYKAGTVLNTGFANNVVTMGQVEDGGISAPVQSSPIVVAYVRAINLKAGDIQRFTLKGPNGDVLASHDGTALPNAQAQRLLYVGKRRPVNGWQAGQYNADYSVIRAGRTVIQKQFSIRI